MLNIDEKFNNELEIFRRESETCLQLLYCYLTINVALSRDTSILTSLNRAPIFWKTILYALQSSYFIGLGRIFDQDSPHNLDRIIKMAQDNLSIFSKNSLADRKRKQASNAYSWIDEYLKKVYVPTSKDFRRLRKLIKKYRSLYEVSYRDIRGKIFAHNNITAESEKNQLFQKTSASEMQKLIIFLYKIYNTLWELFQNGKKPVLRPMPYSVEKMMKQKSVLWRSPTWQESVVLEAQEFLYSLK